jgi:regulatory Fis family protein
MARHLRSETEWVVLPSKTLAQIEEVAIRSAFARHNGNRSKMRRELAISKMTLLRKLSRLGLREVGKPKIRHLQEADLGRAFQKHRHQILDELKISDSTLIRWINKCAPFAVEE